MQDQKASGRADDPIVLDDDDDAELQAALAMSRAEADTTPRKRARSETPEEERRQIAECVCSVVSAHELTFRAIAASQKRETSPYDSDSDTEINRMNAALEASRKEEMERRKRLRLDSGSAPGSAPSTLPGTPTAEPTPEPVPRPVLGLGALGIDRAQMEKERLARMAARQNSNNSDISAKVSSAPASNPRPTPSSKAGPSSRAGPSSPPRSAQSDHPYQGRGPFPRDAAGEYYLDGELRHVALKIGRATSDPTFSPRDVFGKVSYQAIPRS